MPDSRTKAITLMEDFAQRTGLVSKESRTALSVTDVFSVCNFTGLVRVTGETRYMDLALKWVEQVHHTLGRHRYDDPPIFGR